MKNRVFGTITGLALAVTVTASAQAQNPVPITRCWERASAGGSEGWSAQRLSLGNEGSEVFTVTGPLVDYTRIYSAFDASPPQPTLDKTSSTSTLRHVLDSGIRSDVHMSLYDIADPTSAFSLRNVVVNKYSGSKLDWTYRFPHQTNGHDDNFVGVSSDGETLVAASENIFNSFSFDVAFFAPYYSSGVATPQIVQFDPPGVLRDFALSADGTAFLLAGSAGIEIGSTATRAITHTLNFPFGDTFRSKVVISGSGKFVAYATDTRIRIFERSTSTYVLRETYNIPGSYSYETRLEFSENDELLACGINYPPDTFQVRVAAFDMTPVGNPTLLYSKLLTGGGSYDERISDISVAANGQRFAIGNWGNDQGLIKEILVYSKNSSQEIAEIDLPGSVWDLEMSPDGKRVAVGYKHIHANIFASANSSYALYELGRRDFRMSGVPKMGNDLTFTMRVRTGAAARLVCSPANPDYTPADYNGLGKAYVDPGNWTFSHLGVGNVNNEATRSLSTNSTYFAQLAGQTLIFQGLAMTNRKFSRDFVQTTLIP